MLKFGGSSCLIWDPELDSEQANKGCRLDLETELVVVRTAKDSYSVNSRDKLPEIDENVSAVHRTSQDFSRSMHVRHVEFKQRPPQRRSKPKQPATSIEYTSAEGDPQTLKQACYRENPESAMCVQNLNDSRGLAIRITYRISLRSSSLWEPRHPPLKVVSH